MKLQWESSREEARLSGVKMAIRNKLQLWYSPTALIELEMGWGSMQLWTLNGPIRV